MNETVKARKDWNIKFIMINFIQVIAFSEGVERNSKKTRNENWDGEETPIKIKYN